jgi:FdhD protein
LKGRSKDLINQQILEKRSVLRFTNGQMSEIQDTLVAEKPLTIILNEVEMATLICSPYGLRELAVGFLAGEGVLQSPDDIVSLEFREEQGVVWIETHSATSIEETFLRRNFASCCGKGRPSLYFLNDLKQLAPITSGKKFTIEQLLSSVKLLEEAADTFQATGGVHSSALCDESGMIARYEDIGRHNTLDRLLGFVLLEIINPADKLLALSGRASSEMVTKAARIGVPVLVSRSAVTGLAVDFAEELGITLAGFARNNRINIYTHAERILCEDSK